MGSPIELRDLVKDTLNTNCFDPFPPSLTRRGNHFYSDADEINLQRLDTFPKGLVEIQPNSESIKGNIGRSGWVIKQVTLNIYYFSKQKSKTVYNGTTYKGKDIVNLMLNELENTLLNNNLSAFDYHLSPTAIGGTTTPILVTDGNNTFYQGVLPVTYYWSEKYGN